MEGDPSTRPVVGSQVGPAASSAHDHGHSGVERQAPGSVTVSGEARRGLRSADRQESAFLAPASVSDSGPSSIEGFRRASTRSDDEESVAPLRTNISVTSGQSRGKKRKVTCTALDVPDNFVNKLRTATGADIDAVMISQVNQIIKVATTSSTLRGTYIKALKVVASTLTVGIMENARRSIGPACSTGVQRLAEARPSMHEEENEVLRKELARMAVSAP
jgi:hypothetical protein